MDQIGDNLLFRWFVGLAMNAPVWDATTFSKNRDRLLDGDVAQRLLAVIVAQPGLQGLMSDEHFSVDGTLIQAWASHKSFQPSPGVDGNDEPPPGNPAPPAGRNAEQNWRGQKLNNETHQSLTDPDAKLARKSNVSAIILAYAGHVLIENRNGPLAQSSLTRATGTAERDAALVLVDRLGSQRRITLRADQGYDVLGFVQALRERRVPPHIATDRQVSKPGKVTLGRG